MNEAEYRSIPALSATSAKWILRSPAHYKHRMENRVESVAFDVGHGVHAKVLGVGAGVVAYPDEHHPATCPPRKTRWRGRRSSAPLVLRRYRRTRWPQWTPWPRRC